MAITKRKIENRILQISKNELKNNRQYISDILKT